MAQTAPQVAGTGRTTPSPDIDALLNALNAEGPSALPDRPGAQRSMTGEQATALFQGEPVAALPERQAGDDAGRRVQALIRAFDVLHKQVASIASQGATISSVVDAQARQEQALGELQRNMRYLRSIVIQQLQGAAAKEAVPPPLPVKLVAAQPAESYQQADHDAGVLAQWAMLFGGTALGTALGAAMGAYYALTSMLLVFGTAAVVTLLVAGIFTVLSRQARQRAHQARRAMDQSAFEVAITGQNAKTQGRKDATEL